MSESIGIKFSLSCNLCVCRVECVESPSPPGQFFEGGDGNFVAPFLRVMCTKLYQIWVELAHQKRSSSFFRFPICCLKLERLKCDQTLTYF